MTSARYRVQHETYYAYRSDVVHSHQLLHMIPRALEHQRCLEHSLTIEPSNYQRHDEIDAFGNPVTRVEFADAHQRLSITSHLEMVVKARTPVAAHATWPWEEVRRRLAYSAGRPEPEILEASRFRHESPYVRIKQIFDEYAADCFPAKRPLLECAQTLMTRIHDEFAYAPGETDVGTPVGEVLKSKRGVCQDFAHLMIACLRSRGLAARYVSGYLRLRPASGEDSAQDWVGAGQSHAWVSVFVPPCGWVDLDPTNDVRVDTDHITVAWGRDFGDVSPLRGVILGGGAHRLSASVVVEPLEV